MSEFQFGLGSNDLKALAQRAVGLDPDALLRLRLLPDRFAPQRIEVFAPTPFQTLISRRVEATIPGTDAVIRAADFLNGTPRHLGNFLWSARSLPPIEGFSLVDVLPTHIVTDLNTQGKQLARQFSGPLGPPASLLDQTVITVSNGDQDVAIPMRVVFCLSAFGLLPGFDAPASVPRQLRVSAKGRWLRVDAPFATVYYASSLPLLSVQ